MHIRNLNLEGFRGAQHLKLELHESLNVFVGMNGAGKTTILDAAAILLSWLVKSHHKFEKFGQTYRGSRNHEWIP